MEQQPSGNNTLKGFSAAIVAAVCYGTNPLGTLKLYEDGFNSGTVLSYRYGLAILMFALVMLVRRESFAIKWGHAIKFALLGTFFALSSITLYVSFHYMAAGIASTLLFVYPIMTALLMTAFFHEKVTWSTSMAILLAVAGVGMLYQGDGDAKLSTAGFALVMASSLLYSIYIIAVNQWQTTMSSLKFTFWILVFCFIAILVFSWLSGDSLQMLHTPMQWGVRPAVGSSAYGALALLHDDFDQPDRLHPFRHHGGSRTCNSCMYRCAYLWRGILVALGHRHPAHPGRCGSHHSKKKEILKKGKCSDTT